MLESENREGTPELFGGQQICQCMNMCTSKNPSLYTCLYVRHRDTPKAHNQDCHGGLSLCVTVHWAAKTKTTVQKQYYSTSREIDPLCGCTLASL